MHNEWDLNSQLMAIAAHRYCLGRQSYIVGACIDWIRQHHTHFERNTIRVIVRETVDALREGRAGSEMIDAPGWNRLASELFAAMCQADQNWVRRECGAADWPLVDV